MRVAQPVGRIRTQLVPAQWAYFVLEGPLLQTVLVVDMLAYGFLDEVGHLKGLQTDRAVLAPQPDLLLLLAPGSIPQVVSVAPLFLPPDGDDFPPKYSPGPS